MHRIRVQGLVNTVPITKMIRSQSFIVLLIIQCCLAFHSPKQQAERQLHRGTRHEIYKQFGHVSLKAAPADMGDLDDNELSDTAPINARRRGRGVEDYDFERRLGLKRETAVVGAPQTAVIDAEEEEISKMNITQVMTELQAIQSQGPKKYCILGTRHCSFLHQQIVEMLAYALVLSGNHIYTSGAQGTNAAAIRGALRAFKPSLLTVVLPQSMTKQTPESQNLLKDVVNVITMPQNDQMPLDVASRICNSHLLSETEHLISFAFHESNTVLEAAEEAHKLNMLVTLLYLD